MKINFDVVLKEFNGKAIQAPDPDASENNTATTRAEMKMKDFTLRDVALNVLGKDQKLVGSDKSVKAWKLGVKIADGGIIDLKAEEITMIQDGLERVYNQAPIICGQAHLLLDTQYEEPKSAETPAA